MEPFASRVRYQHIIALSPINSTEFSNKLRRDPLEELEAVRRLGGVSFKAHRGFHQRNDQVALSSTVIAFSWSKGDSPPEDGGTRYTWDKAKGKKIHVSLSSLVDKKE